MNIDELAGVKSPDELQLWLIRNPQLQSIATVESLHSQIVAGIVVDPLRAERLASVARWIADTLDDEYARGLAERSEGHVRYANADYPGALRAYESALDHFERLGRESDVAKTLSGAIQTLIYLGRDDTAMQFAARARSIFDKEGDTLRLARLDSNLGNIFYRQDRYAEARSLYQSAYDRLIALDRPQDAAAVLCNMAVASTGLAEFERAAEEYARSRRIAEQTDLKTLAAEVDYNVAYLHFLRGEYIQALRLYKQARGRSEAIGDAYHAALCDLDQSEVYLNLNLIDESAILSNQAAEEFERLGMTYERAKALTFLGSAEHRKRNTTRSLLLLHEARRMFAGASNPVWTAMIDFYRAILLRDFGQIRPALRLARRARTAFAAASLPNRLALVDLLVADIFFRLRRPGDALAAVMGSTKGLSASDHPILFFHAQYLKGTILQAQGERSAAYDAFAASAGLLETIRCRLAGEELKIGFLQNKVEVYAHLTVLAHEILPPPERERAMFDFIERSKARSLADRVTSIAAETAHGSAVSPQFLAIRRELNGLYREFDARETNRRSTSAVWERARRHEEELKRLAVEHSIDMKLDTSIIDWAPVQIDTLAGALPRDTRLIEYFIAEKRLWAGIVGNDLLHFVQLGAVASLRSTMKFLMFQLARTEKQAGRNHDQIGQPATLAHLQQLYALLVEPLEPWIDSANLVIVPHGFLHQLPFQALHDGSSFLIDKATVTYAPSATVFSLCGNRVCRAPQRSLLIGLPGERNPAIEEEIQSIAGLLPHPFVCLGAEATENVLFEQGPACRYIHIATHGQFRRDNPLFSSIRLSDARMSVLDFCRLKLDAELVTLSGCSTGAGTNQGGDELVGLARGLMQAGTRTVLLTLWDIHDSSTALFMSRFYENLSRGQTRAQSLRQAVLALKETWPDPYYWAPFIMSGYALNPCTA